MAANLKFFKPGSFHNSNLKVADIEDLIKQGADINERNWHGETPLHSGTTKK